MNYGRIAYEAYKESLASEDIEVEESWQELEDTHKEAWEDAAWAVLKAVENDDGIDDGEDSK